MLKKIFFMLLIAILVFTILGCRPPESQPQPPQNDDINGQDPIDDNGYPQEVSIWLNNMKEHFVAGSVDIDDKTYLIVNWGAKPNDGYDVEISDLLEQNNTLRVIVKFYQPEGETSDVITYPHTVVEIDRTDRGIYFEDADGEEYIATILGPPPIEPFKLKTNNIKIMSLRPGRESVHVTGLARVFEATINYTFERQNGEILESGFEMATTGGPDWGYFEINKGEVPMEADYFVIYQESAKDGSRMDEIKIRLE